MGELTCQYNGITDTEGGIVSVAPSASLQADVYRPADCKHL